MSDFKTILLSPERLKQLNEENNSAANGLLALSDGTQSRTSAHANPVLPVNQQPKQRRAARARKPNSHILGLAKKSAPAAQRPAPKKASRRKPSSMPKTQPKASQQPNMQHPPQYIAQQAQQQFQQQMQMPQPQIVYPPQQEYQALPPGYYGNPPMYLLAPFQQTINFPQGNFPQGMNQFDNQVINEQAMLVDLIRQKTVLQAENSALRLNIQRLYKTEEVLHEKLAYAKAELSVLRAQSGTSEKK